MIEAFASIIECRLENYCKEAGKGRTKDEAHITGALTANTIGFNTTNRLQPSNKKTPHVCVRNARATGLLVLERPMTVTRIQFRRWLTKSSAS